MYTSLEMQHPMVAPGAAYYLLAGGGILAALGIIAATFPLLARITGPEVARNELHPPLDVLDLEVLAHPPLTELAADP